MIPFKAWQHPRHGHGHGGGQFKDAPLPPDTLIQKAKEFAVGAHDSIGHKRKYTGVPYWTHLSNVVEILKGVPHTPEMLAAAWLHDVVEDVHVPLSEIRGRFGDQVASLVYWLTDKADDTGLPRAQRKAIERERLSRAPGQAQTIKLADMIDNSKDIAKNDPKFFKVFGEEKKLLLDVMTRGDAGLHAQATAMVADVKLSAPKITYAGGANTSPSYLGKTMDWLYKQYGANKAIVHPDHVEYPGLFHGVTWQNAMKHGPPQFQYVPPPPPEPLVMDDLKQVGKQMGTNTGGVYEDKSGKRFYIKKGQTKEHVKNEMIAANLAWRAGAKVLKYRKVKGGNHIATEMVKLTKNRASQLTPEEIRMTHDDFMVHAWLGNYDSIGTGGDNVGIPEGHHHPLALDLGGALEFRPRGKPKGDRFGADVQEFDAMRHGHDLPDPYPDAAAIYSSMTRADIRHSAWKVLDMKDKEIKEIVNKWGGKKELAAKLIARREDIKNKLKSLGAEGDPHSPKGIVVFPVGEDHAVKELNGIPFQEWLPPGDWSTVGGQNHNIDEPEFTEPPAPEPAPYDPKTKHDFVPGDVGLPYGSDLDDFVPFAFPGTKASDVIALPYVPKGKERASGLVIHEPDGRFWLVRPRNGFGGYEHTFPKGRLDKDLNPQANAIKEAWEESGIKAKIVGFIGDFEGSMTKTRYYLAERESGDPTVHQNESDGVLLVPPARLKEFLNAKRDNDIVTSIMGEGVILSFRDFLKGN